MLVYKKCVDFKEMFVQSHNVGVKKYVDFKEMFVQSYNVGVKI